MAVLTDVASVARLSCQSETKPTIRLQTISQSAAAVPFHAGIHLCLETSCSNMRLDMLGSSKTDSTMRFKTSLCASAMATPVLMPHNMAIQHQ